MLRGGVEGKLLIGHMEHSCVLLLYPNSVCQQWQAERQHPEPTLSANTGDMICRGVGGPFVLERPGQSLKLELGIFIKAYNRRSEIPAWAGFKKNTDSGVSFAVLDTGELRGGGSVVKPTAVLVRS